MQKRVEELLAGIDWPCEIYRNYAEKNMSCDPREYSAISWAFGIVDKLIILEDDCLCSSSFFRSWRNYYFAMRRMRESV